VPAEPLDPQVELEVALLDDAHLEAVEPPHGARERRLAVRIREIAPEEHRGLLRGRGVLRQPLPALVVAVEPGEERRRGGRAEEEDQERPHPPILGHPRDRRVRAA
jgi:hypothetical protein